MFFKKKIYLSLLLGFFISSLISIYYVSKYDVYEVSSDNLENHQMIKGPPGIYWQQAHKLKEDLKQNKNYFKTGDEYRNPYLPSKIIFIFSSLVDLELIDEFNNIKIDKKKVFILIIQTIIYYLSILFFYKEIKKEYDERSSLFIVTFLALEPTLLLFHSSFWSESIFFSIQIIFFTLLIKNSKNFTINFIAGFVLGLLFLQRSVAMLYIFPVIFYYILIFKKNFIKPSIFLICGYLFVLIFIGYHNHSRSGIFYISPTQSKDGFYKYMLPSVISKKDNISILQAKDLLKSKEKVWIEENNIDLKKEKDLLFYYNFLQKESFRIIVENPIISATHVLKKTIHFVVLDPLRHVHFYYKYEYKGKPETRYYQSETHMNMIPFRIIYTLLVYSISFCGLIYLYKNNKKNHLLFVVLSLLYFTAVCSWIGNTRYFTPCLIYLSLLFGNGLNLIGNYIKKL
tara:strand:+ start:409 stop:1776 length:1368 start_codon:yes stop_codon:yes gene_type:complete